MSGAAIEIARAIHTRNGLDFAQDLESHLEDGYVMALPDTFIMARAVEYADGRRAWFIKIAIGRLRDLRVLFPFQLQFVSFARSKSGGKHKIYSAERMARLIDAIQ